MQNSQWSSRCLKLHNALMNDWFFLHIGRFENDISTTTSWACHKRSSKQLTSLSAIYGFPYILHQKLNKGFTKLIIWQLMFYVVSLEILRNTSISIKIFDQRALKHCLKQICQGSRAFLKEWWRPGYGVFVCTRSSTITSPLNFWTWLYVNLHLTSSGTRV